MGIFPNTSVLELLPQLIKLKGHGTKVERGKASGIIIPTEHLAGNLRICSHFLSKIFSVTFLQVFMVAYYKTLLK